MINRYNTILMENNMSETMHDGILDNIRSIDKNGTLLDILLEFERVLDEAGLYAYKNGVLVKLLRVLNCHVIG